MKAVRWLHFSKKHKTSCYSILWSFSYCLKVSLRSSKKKQKCMKRRSICTFSSSSLMPFLDIVIHSLVSFPFYNIFSSWVLLCNKLFPRKKTEAGHPKPWLYITICPAVKAIQGEEQKIPFSGPFPAPIYSFSVSSCLIHLNICAVAAQKNGRGKNRSCTWGVPYGSFGSTVSVTQVWGQPGCHLCHRSTTLPPLSAGPAVSRHSAAAHCKPTASAAPAQEQLLVVFQAAFQGWFFFPRKTLTCNYAAVQITGRAGTRKHRKAVTVYNGETHSISATQNKWKYFDIFSSKWRKYLS